MPSRVSGNQPGVLTMGRHKTLPYNVAVIEVGANSEILTHTLEGER